MSEDVQQNEQKKIEEVAEKQHVEHAAPIQPAYKNRGGFMGGGAVTTILFLLAYFLVSYALGVVTAQNTKLLSMIPNSGIPAGQTAGAAGQPAQVGLQDFATVTKKIEIDEKRVKGNKDAKVTIVEFSDFECPFCGKFYSEAYKKIVEKYVNTGKVKIAFKDFPLSFHPQAQKSAEASRCALEQNKFWEMHDKMFENQTTLSVDNLKKWAAELGMKSDQFNQCLDSNKYEDAVKKELAEGIELGVQGTPSFVINGTALVGAQPIEAFEKIIEEKLK